MSSFVEWLQHEINVTEERIKDFDHRPEKSGEEDWYLGQLIAYQRAMYELKRRNKG